MSTIERLAENATDDVVAAHIDSMRQFQQDLLQARAEYAALERRNAELVEAARLAESALSFTYGGEPVDPTGAITVLRAALAHSAQEKTDAAE